MASNRRREAAQRISRITDVVAETEAMQTTITEYKDIPLISYADTPIVTLEKAVEPLISMLPDVLSKANEAKAECKNPPADGLTLDESASIRLYSMEWQPRNECLYVALNTTLRLKDKNRLKPWFRYVKLFLSALERLPSKHRTVYRGVKIDMHKDYKKGETTVSWAFWSCTASIGVLNNEIFLGQKGDRTMFAIECDTVKDIRNHSCFSGEDEMLIIAGTQFKIIDSLNTGNSLHVVQLEEEKSMEAHLEQLFSSASQSSTGRSTTAISRNLLIWLDSNIDESKDDCRKTIAKLRKIIKNVNTFTDANECEEFIENISEEKIFLMVSGSLGQSVVPTIHDKRQINAIVVFCGNKSYHEKWAKQYTKVCGVFTTIDDLCKSIERAVQEAKQESISLEFVNDTQLDVDKLDPSYMYTKIFMEILLKINFTKEDFQEFVQFFRNQYGCNTREIRIIDEFEKEYEKNKAIWWYTRETCICRVLIKALRTMDFTILCTMGFYIQDLYRQIEILYSEQFDEHHHHHNTIITVYHGLPLYVDEFAKLKKSQNGIITFNHILSCSSGRDAALNFVHHFLHRRNRASVIFRIHLDPQKSTIPFAFIGHVNEFPGEDEILLAPHSVFRIGNIECIDENDHLYQADLTQVIDPDSKLFALEKHIRKEITGPTNRNSLINLLFKVRQYSLVEELCQKFIKQENDEKQISLLFYQLGLVSHEKGKYNEALEYHEKALKIQEKFLPLDHPDLARSYNDIGLVYNGMSEYTKALKYQETALEIRKKSLPSNHPDLARSYNNIAFVYNKLRDYSRALSFLERAVNIGESSLLADHPDLHAWKHSLGQTLELHHSNLNIIQDANA